MGAPGIRFAPMLYLENGTVVIVWYHFDTEAEAKKTADEYVRIGFARQGTTMMVYVPQFIH